MVDQVFEPGKPRYTPPSTPPSRKRSKPHDTLENIRSGITTPAAQAKLSSKLQPETAELLASYLERVQHQLQDKDKKEFKNTLLTTMQEHSITHETDPLAAIAGLDAKKLQAFTTTLTKRLPALTPLLKPLIEPEKKESSLIIIDLNES